MKEYCQVLIGFVHLLSGSMSNMLIQSVSDLADGEDLDKVAMINMSTNNFSILQPDIKQKWPNSFSNGIRYLAITCIKVTDLNTIIPTLNVLCQECLSWFAFRVCCSLCTELYSNCHKT